MHLVQRFGYEVTLGRVLSILGAFQLDLEPLTCGLALLEDLIVEINPIITRYLVHSPTYRMEDFAHLVLTMRVRDV